MKFLKSYSTMLFKSMTLLLLIAFTFSSCKKDKDDTVVTPSSPVVGKWVGVFTLNGAPTGELAFVIKEGGVLEAQNIAGQKIGDGTWQLGGSSGVTFSCSYTAAAQTVNLFGTLIEPTKINGSWGTGSSHFNGGFFNVTKQP